jgi:eukaryotic-like serine/threonine-protein kinase
VLVARRYKLGEALGHGGMGQVWRAVDEVLGRNVAVKLAHPGSASEAVAERFRLEARAAGRISDPHVVAVYDFGVDEDRLFLVMELVEGRSLADELHRCGPLPPDRAAGLVAQAARGLASAHDHAVVHRDIKPANLLLATDDTEHWDGVDRTDNATCLLKIADFGIARVTDDSGALTATGEIAGTSHYLAPERALGEPGGPASDVYSLGCVAYHLVTGRPPFQGDAPAAIAFQHVHGKPVPPHDLCPEVTGAFEDVVLRMLAKDPAQRPAASELAEWTPTSPVAGAARPAASRPLLVIGRRSASLGASFDGPTGSPAAAVSPAEHTDTDTKPLGPIYQRPPRPPRSTKRAALAAVATAVVIGAAMSWTTLHPGTEAERSKPDAPISPTPLQDTHPVPSPRPPTSLATNTPDRPTTAAGQPTRRTAADPTTPTGQDSTKPPKEHKRGKVKPDRKPADPG